MGPFFLHVKFTLLFNYVIKHYYEDIWVIGGLAPPFFTSALNGGEWTALRLCRFTPGHKALGMHWIGDWMVVTNRLDAMETRNII
jgi:hypothetical protein